MSHESLFLLGLALLVLLILGGVFSAAETALTSASRAQMHQKAKRGDRSTASARTAKP